MAQPLWRECVEWLDKWKILNREDFPPDSELVVFGQHIRDGVVLCLLITKLDPSALDFREVCQRTSMSQYMSLKNIRLFLRACRKFDLGDSDLFEPAMLFDYTDFGRVIRCLSKLSKCPKVARLGIDGFPAVHNRSLSEDEDIYKRLEDLDQEDQYPEHCYAPEEEIFYEDLCSVARHSQPSSLLQTPVDKRDYSINELVDTEKNYIEALAMIKTKFIRPLSSVLKEEDKKCIFYGIEKLHEIHTGFHSDLIKACTGANGLKLPTVFLNWKEKMLIYGDLCSNLPVAQQTIEAVCRDKMVADEIERCQHEASRSAYFNLKDLITVPTQRVLKYHLLLKNLCNYTDQSHEDYQGLCLAHEAMLDVAEYINEARRDHEMRQIISDVQLSISDWNTVENSSLVEYGRLIKDGELKLRSHEESSRAAKLRYVFLFNRGVIFCKATRGDQYNFRLFLPLNKYKLEDFQTQRPQNGRQEARWTHQWLLVDNQNQTAYTLYSKSAEAKNKWIKAFKEALDDLYPEEARSTDHNYILHTFPTSPAINCDLCQKLFKGSLFQGYKCVKCNLSAHKKCLRVVQGCGVPIPPPRPLPLPRPVSPGFNVPSLQNLDSYPWYAGDMPREAANCALRSTPVGTYLLRLKSTDNTFALSLKTIDEIKHMKVVQTTDSVGHVMFYLSQNFSFPSVVELVNRYIHNSLRESFRGLDAYLEVPWKHIYQTAKVIENYTAGDDNVLAISRGQHIIIANKEGDARGWWKGRFNDKEGYFPKTYVVEDNFYQRR